MSSSGVHYGDVEIGTNKTMKFSFKKKTIFDLPLENISMCVVPANNANDLEMQFHEVEKADREEDSLAQITFHFPAPDDPEDDTQAEEFKTAIMDSGMIRSTKGKVIIEFEKELGNFIAPRGKYAIQVMKWFGPFRNDAY